MTFEFAIQYRTYADGPLWTTRVYMDGWLIDDESMADIMGVAENVVQITGVNNPIYIRHPKDQVTMTTGQVIDVMLTQLQSVDEFRELLWKYGMLENKDG